MFSDNVAQYPTIAVNDGKKKWRKLPVLWKWLGAANIGPKPPALFSIQNKSVSDITSMNGAEKLCRKRIDSTPRQTISMFSAQKPRKLAHSTAGALAKSGGDSWFFLTADYAFGHALERDATAVVTANGGKVLGSVSHPLNNQDFSSFLLQAQSSKAKIIGLANAGGDTINAIKQGAEFGITSGGQHFAALLFYIGDVEALGLKVAQGLVLTEAFYWDMNDSTRAWSKRWQAEHPGKFPNMNQAGDYAATLHYLKAVAALKSTADGKAEVAKMKEIPTDDPVFGKGVIRADGRKIHPVYLFEVKSPAESKYPGDDYKLRATIPAEEAFRPMKDDNCPMLSSN